MPFVWLIIQSLFVILQIEEVCAFAGRFCAHLICRQAYVTIVPCGFCCLRCIERTSLPD